MESVVGVFMSHTQALQAERRLESIGIAPEQINLLLPGRDGDPAGIPTVEAEAPGVGTALGGVVGGATGAAAGVTLGAAAAAVLPGVGPVLVLGAAAAGLLGAGGALGGAMIARAAGDAVDEALYRRGFQTALRRDTCGVPFEEVEARLRAELGDACADVAFRRGYERGQAHERSLRPGRDAGP